MKLNGYILKKDDEERLFHNKPQLAAYLNCTQYEINDAILNNKELYGYELIVMKKQKCKTNKSIYYDMRHLDEAFP